MDSMKISLERAETEIIEAEALYKISEENAHKFYKAINALLKK